MPTNQTLTVQTVDECLDLIRQLATDKRSRVLLRDQCEWLEMKLKEIAKLAGIAKRLQRRARRTEARRREKCSSRLTHAQPATVAARSRTTTTERPGSTGRSCHHYLRPLSRLES